MKSAKWILLLAALLIISGQAGAVTLPTEGGGKRPSSANASGVISRGGVITAIGGETIAVDGIAYPFSVRSARIHSVAPLKLQAGAPVRFNTGAEPGGRERIIEIWVIGDSRSAPAK